MPGHGSDHQGIFAPTTGFFDRQIQAAELDDVQGRLFYGRKLRLLLRVSCPDVWV